MGNATKTITLMKPKVRIASACLTVVLAVGFAAGCKKAEEPKPAPTPAAAASKPNEGALSSGSQSLPPPPGWDPSQKRSFP